MIGSVHYFVGWFIIIVVAGYSMSNGPQILGDASLLQILGFEPSAPVTSLQ